MPQRTTFLQPEVPSAAAHSVLAAVFRLFFPCPQEIRTTIKYMMQRYTTTQWVPFPVEQVFAFFANPANLPRLMPAPMATRIEEARMEPPPARVGPYAEQGVAAGEGSEMEISFRPLPFVPMRVRWTARIVEFEWNSHFCDEQVRGPFARFRHCHRISAENRDGVDGSMVTDAIEFEMPFGILGRMAGFAVRRNLAGSFAYRQKRLPECLKAQYEASAKR